MHGKYFLFIGLTYWMSGPLCSAIRVMNAKPQERSSSAFEPPANTAFDMGAVLQLEDAMLWECIVVDNRMDEGREKYK